MASGIFSFDHFVLDPGNRLLRRGATPVELNARYLDALALLVREQGKLVSKNRFMEEVWSGIPVTDEALTQCIRTLRRQLGDDAARPRFIETVPKHGYRFIARVENDEPGGELGPIAERRRRREQFLLLGGAGTVGGGVAGLIGGLIYGFAAASQPGGIGAVSVLLVVASVTMIMALLGGAGVSFGIAAAGLVSGRPWGWAAVGGALGGLLVGASVKLLGLDAFELLLGRSPGNITGAGEGALLGGAVGFGGWLGNRIAGSGSMVRRVAVAALSGGLAGAAIALLGGRLMAGSLDLLATGFPGSRLRLGAIGRLFGENGLGPVGEAVTAGLEGLLFAGCVVGTMIIARRNMTDEYRT